MNIHTCASLVAWACILRGMEGGGGGGTERIRCDAAKLLWREMSHVNPRSWKHAENLVYGVHNPARSGEFNTYSRRQIQTPLRSKAFIGWKTFNETRDVRSEKWIRNDQQTCQTECMLSHPYL